MGHAVNNTGADYAEQVRKTAEEAVVAAGFHGWVCPQGLTVESLVRVSEVLGVDLEDFFPTTGGAEPESARSESARTGRSRAPRRFGLARRSQWRSCPSGSGLGATG